MKEEKLKSEKAALSDVLRAASAHLKKMEDELRAAKDQDDRAKIDKLDRDVSALGASIIHLAKYV
jgi:hypothetical protein